MRGGTKGESSSVSPYVRNSDTPLVSPYNYSTYKRQRYISGCIIDLFLLIALQHMLPKQYRLHDEYIFRKLKKQGATVHTPYFVLTYMPNSANSLRFGFIASAKVGGAVQRHRAVRVLREAVREVLPNVARGFDIVLIARVNLLQKQTTDVTSVLTNALEKAKLVEYARMQDE